MQEKEVVAPVRRIYFAIQMLYVDETNRSVYLELFDRCLEEFVGATEDQQTTAQRASGTNDVESYKYYRALSTCKKILPFKEARLKHGTEGSQLVDRDSLDVQQAALAN